MSRPDRFGRSMEVTLEGEKSAMLSEFKMVVPLVLAESIRKV